MLGAESRNRTGTPSLARDFESRASTSSAISAREDAIMPDLRARSNRYAIGNIVTP